MHLIRVPCHVFSVLELFSDEEVEKGIGELDRDYFNSVDLLLDNLYIYRSNCHQNKHLTRITILLLFERCCTNQCEAGV